MQLNCTLDYISICLVMFYMEHKGREKATKVVDFVAKWLNFCPSTVNSKIPAQCSRSLIFHQIQYWAAGKYLL